MRQRIERALEPITLSRFWCERIHPLFAPWHYYLGARAVGNRRGAMRVALLETWEAIRCRIWGHRYPDELTVRFDVCRRCGKKAT